MRDRRLSITMRFETGSRSALFGLAAFVLCAAILCGARPASGADFGVKLPTVKKIEIIGNRSLGDKALKKRMRTKEARFYKIFRQPTYRRDMLKRDVETLRSFYRMNGFAEAGISIDSVDMSDDGGSVRIRIMVNEGPQTVVRAVRVAGQDVVGETELRKGLKLVEGAPYNPTLIEVDRYALLSRFFEDGYLGAKALADVRIDSTAVDIDWTVALGDPIHLRETRVTGMRGVRERYVRRELTFKEGELFRTKKILESKQNLYDTGYFNSVEIEPDSIDLASREVDLLVQVRERKMGYLESGFGVGNVHGNRVFGEFGQRNIFGTGNTFYLKSSYAFQLFPENEFTLDAMDFRSKYVRHEGELRFPHVLSTWNTFSLGAFYERDATVDPIIIKDRGFTTKISRRFSRQTSLLFDYSLERVERINVGEELSRSHRRAVDATFLRDTRDFYFNPQRGSVVSAEGRFTGGFLGGEDHYYVLVGSAQRYMRLAENTVFAYRVRGGYAEAFGDSRSTGLPIESRFFIGGGNSVRGYKENSLGPLGSEGEPRGGRILLLTNAELRVPVPYLARYNFGAAFFMDGGNVWNAASEIRIEDFRFTMDRDETARTDYMYGAGIGLRYYTPVGPIRLDVGFPLKRTKDMDYDHWIHISLGQIF